MRVGAVVAPGCAPLVTHFLCYSDDIRLMVFGSSPLTATTFNPRTYGRPQAAGIRRISWTAMDSAVLRRFEPRLGLRSYRLAFKAGAVGLTDVRRREIREAHIRGLGR